MSVPNVKKMLLSLKEKLRDHITHINNKCILARVFEGYVCVINRFLWWMKLNLFDHPLYHIDLKLGDIAIDCGANIGKITERMASTGATVYAYEPNPYAYQVLRRRFKNKPNVYCINKGVWDREGKFRLFLHKNAPQDQIKWSTGSSLFPTKNNVNIRTYVEVEVIDLSKFISDLGKEIKVIKLDVEGAEFQIINKLIDTDIIKKIKYLFVELHGNRIARIQLKQRINKEELNNIFLNWI